MAREQAVLKISMGLGLARLLAFKTNFPKMQDIF
jgi:hypothetical protein